MCEPPSVAEQWWKSTNGGDSTWLNLRAQHGAAGPEMPVRDLRCLPSAASFRPHHLNYRADTINNDPTTTTADPPHPI